MDKEKSQKIDAMKCICKFFVSLFVLASSYALAEALSPPEQPPMGPGGYDYPHGAAAVKGPYWAERHSGNDNFRYYLYEPAEPTPDEAPVILFLHGWGGMSPNAYEKCIEHIVRKGYTVVWVQYQNGVLTPPWLFARYAVVTWKDALKRLDAEDSHVRPQKNIEDEYITAFMGHSAGGYLSAIVAAKAAKQRTGIPKPYAVVAVEPGGLGIIPKARFSDIDPDTKFVIVVGDEDNIVCKSTAVFIWNEISQIPDAYKDFLLVRSDYYGDPFQVSHHFFPVTSDVEVLDARDFYVTFKLTVGAFNCAFAGLDCEYGIGNGSFEQIDMGNWSDGQPMIPMVWVEDPNFLETTCEDP